MERELDSFAAAPLQERRCNVQRQPFTVRPDIAADVAARLRRSITQLEVERSTLVELGEALDTYRYSITERVLDLGAVLGRLRREARRYEWLAERRGLDADQPTERPVFRRAA